MEITSAKKVFDTGNDLYLKLILTCKKCFSQETTTRNAIIENIEWYE